MKTLFAERSLIVKYCITAVIAALLALFYAFSSAFPFKYELGSQWSYPDLITEAPITITMAGAQGDSIVKQVEHQFVPVFKMDKDVAEKQKELLKKDFQRQLHLAGKDNSFPDVNKSPQLYLQFAERLLSKIYEQGILPDHEKLQGRTEVQILRADQLKVYPLSKVYTIKTARQAIADSLPGSKLRESEFLMSVMEDKIAVNLSYDDENSEKARNYTFQNYLQRKDTLKKGTVIAEKGSFISEEVFHKIETYRKYIEGSRSGSTIFTRFIWCFLLNLIFLSLIDLHIATFQPRLLISNGFLVYLALLVFALQGVHLYTLRFESVLLVSPVLLFPVLLKKSTLPFINAGIFVLMVLMASQSVNLPYVYTISFLSGGLFYIFSEKYFYKISNGPYVQAALSGFIVVAMYTMISLQQNENVQWVNLSLTAAAQVFLMLTSTKYNTYVK